MEYFLSRGCGSLLAGQGRPSAHHPQRRQGAGEPGADWRCPSWAASSWSCPPPLPAGHMGSGGRAKATEGLRGDERGQGAGASSRQCLKKRELRTGNGRWRRPAPPYQVSRPCPGNTQAAFLETWASPLPSGPRCPPGDGCRVPPAHTRWQRGTL